VSDPARAAVAEFDAMLYLTVPGPVPLAPSRIAIHVALATVVQAHDAAEVPTVTVPVPPSPENV